jgi:hypothetical protein
MLRLSPRLFAPLLPLLFAATTPAGAIVQGTSSSLGSYTVRLIGSHYCSGVAIGHSIVVTAAHCARGMHVMAGGGSVGIAGVSRSAVLDDGRRVSVSGDAAILRLSAPLSGVSAAPIGDGGGDRFTIAGYGTVTESERGAFGALHEASLVSASAYALVDPNRSGSISASVCSAIPAARSCVAACWSASSCTLRTPRRASPAAISRAGRRSGPAAKRAQSLRLTKPLPNRAAANIAAWPSATPVPRPAHSAVG